MCLWMLFRLFGLRLRLDASAFNSFIGPLDVVGVHDRISLRTSSCSLGGGLGTWCVLLEQEQSWTSHNSEQRDAWLVAAKHSLHTWLVTEKHTEHRS